MEYCVHNDDPDTTHGFLCSREKTNITVLSNVEDKHVKQTTTYIESS